ncbi:uncharacterized protein LY79DRAFT_537099 [Colletotrichum navitas]|uniref:Uncharacterized protein n=1 Tax=Colletotrichum navitas TaxID=681940 RepID=A0AAD8QAM4_9PEZI|nr:uncharacterized protein LY79DRAFT_537099 [Colletotrichum navitas]KAK1599145.1 hypothetical protein LY79DRAFT_537099 [Colletotrichum navitas]
MRALCREPQVDKVQSDGAVCILDAPLCLLHWMIHDEKRRPAAVVRQYCSADQGGLSWVRMQLASSPDAMTMLNRETEAPPNHRRHLLQASRPQLDMSDKGAIFESPLKSACANDGDSQYSLAFLLGHDTFLSLPCFSTFSKLLPLREDHISLRFYAQHEDVIQQAHDVEWDMQFFLVSQG